MKIAIIGANGNAGSKIVEEALARGHEVTAIVRSENRSLAEKVLVKDALELTKEDLLSFDVVVNAFGAWTEESLPHHSVLAERLVSLLEESSVHLLVVGGAGSLYLDDQHSLRLMDSPDFPKEYFPVAKATADALDIYRKASGVQWTYVSPAADFVVDGTATGHYTLAGELFQVNAQGESRISYADYALAMLDIIEAARPRCERVSVFS